MRQKDADKAEAIARLREWLEPGDTVYTILRHVSSSGMTREIGLVLMNGRGDFTGPTHPNWAASKALGYSQGKRDGLRVSGCGMDMGFSLVYDLGRTLWPDGYPCCGETCRSNDHSNGLRDRTPGAHHHNDGGYALRHEWL